MVASPTPAYADSTSPLTDDLVRYRAFFELFGLLGEPLVSTEAMVRIFVSHAIYPAVNSSKGSLPPAAHSFGVPDPVLRRLNPLDRQRRVGAGHP